MQAAENASLELLRVSLGRARNPASCALDAGSVIADFVENLGKAWPVLSSHQRHTAAIALVESPIFMRTRKFAQRRLAKLLQINGEEPKNYMLALAQVLQAEPETTTEAAEEVCKIIWHYRFTEPDIVAAYLELLAVAALNKSAIFEKGMEHQLLRYTLSCGSTKSSDMLREAAVHALITLYTTPQSTAAKQALGELRNQVHIAPQIMAAVVWRLNREKNLAKRAAAAELCRAVLADPVLCDSFYLNDLQVLIDVLLRDLDDLPGTAVELTKKLLTTLCLAAGNPSLAAEQYAAGRIAAVLRSIKQTASDNSITELVNNLYAMEWLHIPEDQDTAARVQESGFGTDSDPDYSSGSGSDAEPEVLSPFDTVQDAMLRDTHRYASSVPSLPGQIPPQPERPQSTPPVPARRQKPRPPPPLPRIQSSTDHIRRPPPPPPRSISQSEMHY